ncbi:MAG: hypothetical protein EA366_01975 [Spirulina sp. DLM2.Bin59]|nr:MAG: hypothetical protein EA366_01975 [Spirulina sp. DLM2.Bin59]
MEGSWPHFSKMEGSRRVLVLRNRVSGGCSREGGMQETRFLGWVSRNRVFGAIWREKEPIGATRFLGWGDGGAVLTLRLWMNYGK